MNILNVILMDCTLEMLPSTAYLSHQDKMTFLYIQQGRQCTVT